jgi:hypothetical protein
MLLTIQEGSFEICWNTKETRVYPNRCHTKNQSKPTRAETWSTKFLNNCRIRNEYMHKFSEKARTPSGFPYARPLLNASMRTPSRRSNKSYKTPQEELQSSWKPYTKFGNFRGSLSDMTCITNCVLTQNRPSKNHKRLEAHLLKTSVIQYACRWILFAVHTSEKIRSVHQRMHTLVLKNTNTYGNHKVHYHAMLHFGIWPQRIPQKARKPKETIAPCDRLVLADEMATHGQQLAACIKLLLADELATHWQQLAAYLYTLQISNIAWCRRSLEKNRKKTRLVKLKNFWFFASFLFSLAARPSIPTFWLLFWLLF